MAAAARTKQEQIVLDFFRILSTGELEAIRKTLHPDAEWRPMVENIPGAGIYGPRDVIIDTFLAPVRGMFAPGDPKTTVNTIASAGDFVMCESRGLGKLADGRTYDNRYAWALELKDGLVHRIREYMDSTIAFARKNGFVQTLFGRKIHTPEINAKGPTAGFARRAAINAPIQGAAADIIRRAMIRMPKAISHLPAKMLLQVHDELLFEVEESAAEELTKIARDVMEQAPLPAVHLDVPMVVEAGQGANWAEAH